MKIGVYSLKRILFQGEGKSVNCKTAVGEITILDHHRPLIGMLEQGVVRVTDSEIKEHYFQVNGGFIEVRPQNETRLLVDE